MIPEKIIQDSYSQPLFPDKWGNGRVYSHEIVRFAEAYACPFTKLDSIITSMQNTSLHFKKSFREVEDDSIKVHKLLSKNKNAGVVSSRD